jgi:hypothetical protein
MYTLALLFAACATSDPGPPALVTCPDGTATHVDPDGDGILIHWCDRSGVRDGGFVRAREDGTRLEAGGYARGKKDGTWIRWHDNGEMATRGSYAHGGKPEGMWTWWHDNGALAREGAFLRGREQGTWKAGWPSGRKKAEGTYHAGSKEDGWTYFADADGSPVERRETWYLGKLVEGVPVEVGREALAWLDGIWPDVAWAEAEARGKRVPGTWEQWQVSNHTYTGARMPDRGVGEVTVLRIEEKKGRIVHSVRFDQLHPFVAGKPDAELTLVEASPTLLRFTGDDAYPSEVRYARDGDVLTVTYTGNVGGQAAQESWQFRTDLDLRIVQREVAATFERVSAELGR